MKTTTITIGAPSPRQICSNAGLLAFARTATHLAITDTIDDALPGQQNPNLTHTVGSTMTSLALALILGADDVSDIDLLDPLVATGLITQVPSDSTIHRRHQELTDLGDQVHTPLAAAMKTIRTRAWNKLGPRNPATRATTDNPLVIDLDATEITAHSDKERASATWKKHFGFHPLCAFIDLNDDHGGGSTVHQATHRQSRGQHGGRSPRRPQHGPGLIAGSRGQPALGKTPADSLGCRWRHARAHRTH